MTSASGFISTQQALVDPLAPGLSLLLTQIIIILVVCRLIAVPFSYLNQPRVIAEVIGGILLGPTALGQWKWFSKTIFYPTSLKPLSLLANIGLVFFLLLMGLELDLGIVKQRLSKSLLISLSGICLPFALSVGVSNFFYYNLPGASEGGPYLNFLLFIGIAMSITALPVLARILTERNLLHTPVGVIVISAAAVEDAISWAFLALIVALISSTSPLLTLYIILSALGFTAFMLVIGRPILLWLYRRLDAHDRTANGSLPIISPSMVVVAFVVTMVASFITSMIGIHAIFGGFIAGLSLPRENGFAIGLTHRLEDFVMIVLLPLYFAYSGLKTDIGSLSDGLSWLGFLAAFSCAVIGKIVGCTLASRATGSSWRESFTIGAMMNTKGLVEIIVLNIGLDAGIITTQIFSIMVLMAIVTTLMTTPMIAWLYPRSAYITEQEPDDTVLTLDEKRILSPSEKELNLVVAVPDLASVPSMMNLLQYLHKPKDEEPSKPDSIMVHVARLIPMNDRMSGILLATNEQQTIERDPALSIFKAFGNLKHVCVVPHLMVSNISDFPRNVAQIAYDEHSDYIMIPLNSDKKQQSKTKKRLSEKTGVMSLWNNTSASSSASTEAPIMMLTSSNASAKTSDEVPDARIADVIDQLLRKSRVKVGVFVDRGQITRPSGSLECAIHILVPFFGGPDDREAVIFALRLGVCESITITVFHVHNNRKYVDKDDKKMLEIIQDMSKSPTKARNCNIKYVLMESDKPVTAILDELRRKEYTLVVAGHIGPRWVALMEEKADEEANIEENNSTVWSILKQETVTSVNSAVLDGPVPSSSKAQKKLDRILGPTGSAIMTEYVGNASLLIIRKLRIDLG